MNDVSNLRSKLDLLIAEKFRIQKAIAAKANQLRSLRDKEEEINHLRDQALKSMKFLKRPGFVIRLASYKDLREQLRSYKIEISKLTKQIQDETRILERDTKVAKNIDLDIRNLHNKLITEAVKKNAVIIPFVGRDDI